MGLPELTKIGWIKKTEGLKFLGTVFGALKLHTSSFLKATDMSTFIGFSTIVFTNFGPVTPLLQTLRITLMSLDFSHFCGEFGAMQF